MPRSTPHPDLSVSRSCKQVSVPHPRMVLLWVSELPFSCSSSLLQDLERLLFSASMWWFGKTCAMLHWVMVGSREAQAQESDFSSQWVTKRAGLRIHAGGGAGCVVIQDKRGWPQGAGQGGAVSFLGPSWGGIQGEGDWVSGGSLRSFLTGTLKRLEQV